jgi:hypothetical protein
MYFCLIFQVTGYVIGLQFLRYFFNDKCFSSLNQTAYCFASDLDASEWFFRKRLSKLHNVIYEVIIT